MKTLRERLVVERNSRGWSQRRAAQELAVDVGTVSGWERGAVPSAASLAAIATAYGIPGDELIALAAAADAKPPAEPIDDPRRPEPSAA